MEPLPPPQRKKSAGLKQKLSSLKQKIKQKLSSLKLKIRRKLNPYQLALFDWALSCILIATSIILFMLGDIWLLLNYSSDIRPREFQAAGTLNLGTPVTASDRPVVSTANLAWGDQPHATIRLEAQLINAADQLLKCNARLSIPKDIFSQMWNIDEKNYIYDFDKENLMIMKLKTNYLNEKIELKIRNKFSISQIDSKISLGSFFNEDLSYGEENAFVANIELPLVGQPDLYPSDWYWLYEDFYITMPEKICLHEKGSPSFRFVLPLEVLISPGIRMAGKSLSVKQEGWFVSRNGKVSSTNPPISPRTANLLITRNPSFKWYIYIMSIIPLALGVILGHILLIGPTSHTESIHSLILDAAAVMLAILPFRQVLVPSEEVQGMTRIDFILGFSLVLIVCLIFFKYGLDMWKPRQSS